VVSGTDEINQRRKRETILRELLESVFVRRDSQRFFSGEQRRIMCDTAEARCLSECGAS
jgi:hypothetical protein